MFKKSITKEELDETPAGHYEGKIVVIEHKNNIAEAMKIIRQCAVCGFDTESLPSFRKGESHGVALLQIATEDVVFLIRLNKTGITSDIVRFFEAPEICKVGIALKDDMQRLNKLHSITAKNMIDLNEYCAKLGFESIGAKKLSALILGLRISKRQQTSNWELYTLSQAQRVYAATDAWVCREIYLKLNDNE
jgi:ribonuclease D